MDEIEGLLHKLDNVRLPWLYACAAPAYGVRLYTSSIGCADPDYVSPFFMLLLDGIARFRGNLDVEWVKQVYVAATTETAVNVHKPRRSLPKLHANTRTEFVNVFNSFKDVALPTEDTQWLFVYEDETDGRFAHGNTEEFCRTAPSLTFIHHMVTHGSRLSISFDITAFENALYLVNSAGDKDATEFFSAFTQLVSPASADAAAVVLEPMSEEETQLRAMELETTL